MVWLGYVSVCCMVGGSKVLLSRREENGGVFVTPLKVEEVLDQRDGKVTLEYCPCKLGEICFVPFLIVQMLYIHKKPELGPRPSKFPSQYKSGPPFAPILQMS
jgi:hypothetical protein